MLGRLEDVSKFGDDIQSHPTMRRNITSMSFPPSAWEPDGKTLRSTIDLGLAASPRVPCSPILHKVYEAFQKSGEGPRCLAKEGSGHMGVDVRARPGEPAVVVEIAGPLLASEAGACYAAALRAAAATIPVPAAIGGCVMRDTVKGASPAPLVPQGPRPQGPVAPLTNPRHALVWTWLEPFGKAKPEVELRFACKQDKCTLTAIGPRAPLDSLTEYLRSAPQGLIGSRSFHTPIGLSHGTVNAFEVELQVLPAK